MSPDTRAVMALLEWFMPGCAIHQHELRMREIARGDGEVADLLIITATLVEEIHRAEYHAH